MDGRPSPPHLSVVVPVYNDAKLLRRSLACLVDQSLAREAYEIVVVDDGSTDGTPVVIAEACAASDLLHPVRLDRNRGRSAARNAGILAAAAPLVVFLDSDVLVRSDFLERHADLHRSAGRPVVGRGPVVTIPTAEIPPHTPRFGPSRAYLTTANASVPRSSLIEAGMFDEGFRLYGWEDFDMGARLKARGLPRAFSTEAVAFHVQPPSTFESLEDDLAKEEERAQMALYFLRKHPGFATRMLISDTMMHRAVNFVLGGAGVLSIHNAPRVARWLNARGWYSLALLVTRGVLNMYYLEMLDRARAAEQEGSC